MKLLRTLALGKENGSVKGKALSRRSLLKALGVSAAASPFIPTLDAWADGAAIRRLLLIFTPDGMVPEQWWPTGTETNWQFPAGGILTPLERHKNDMIIMRNLPHKTQGSGAHEQAMGGLFTGNSLIGKTGGAASVDQIIVQQLKSQLTTDFPSLQFGVHPFYGGEGDLTSKLTNNNSYTIYGGPSQRIPAEGDIYKVYDRVFGNSAGGGAAAVMGEPGMDKLRAERKSILDFIKDELTDVTNRVAKSDRMKIESHIEGTRQIEKRLSSAGPKMVGAVARPQGGIALDRNANFPMLIPIMNDLLVHTLASDRTRISYMQYSRGFSLTKHDWLGAKEQHHFLSHKTSEKPILAAIQKWYMEHIAKLFESMKAISDGGSTLFDNTLIVYANELHTGWDHSPGPTATFWASKGAGAIGKTGRYIDFAGANDHNQMLCTIAHAMGAKGVTQVGNMGKGGVLPNILA